MFSSRSSQGRPVKNSPCQNFRFHARLPKRFSSGNLERENIEFTSNLDMKGSSGNGFLRVGKFCHERFHLNCHPPNLWGTRFSAWLRLEVTLSTLADISAWIWNINKHCWSHLTADLLVQRVIILHGLRRGCIGSPPYRYLVVTPPGRVWIVLSRLKYQNTSTIDTSFLATFLHNLLYWVQWGPHNVAHSVASLWWIKCWLLSSFFNNSTPLGAGVWRLITVRSEGGKKCPLSPLRSLFHATKFTTTTPEIVHILIPCK